MKNKRGKLIVLCGVSGSGKSAWAHEQWLNNKKEVIIVSRDNLREGLFGYNSTNIEKYYSSDSLNSCEKLISEYSHELIQSSLSKGKTVIADNTHLKLKYLKEYKRYGVPTDVVIFSTPLQDCIKRSVHCNEEKVKEQYSNFTKFMSTIFVHADGGMGSPILFNGVISLQNFNLGKTDTIVPKSGLMDCVIVDIDGTLAIRGDRSPYDWKRVSEDTLNTNVATIVRDLYEAGNIVIICSGRDSVCKEDTKLWLKSNNITYNGIYMRREQDTRKDAVVKEEMWRSIAKSYNIVALIDDRKQVIDRARELGLTVLDVADNRF